MRVSTLQRHFVSGLGFAKSATAPKGSMPMMGCFHLYTGDDSLNIEATDTENYLQVSVGAMVDEEGAVCVNAAKFTNLISTLDEDRVDLSLLNGNTANPVLEIQSPHSTEATMHGVPASEFPPPFIIEEKVATAIDPQVLKQSIQRVKVAIGREHSRPVLTGVRFAIGPKGFQMVAADGFRLAVQEGYLIDPVSDPVEVIIAGTTLGILTRLLGQTEDAVEIDISTDKRLIRFKVVGKNRCTYDLMAFLIGGDYPNFEAFIPKSSEWSFSTDVKSLLSAVKSAAVYATDFENKVGSNLVRLWTEQEEVAVAESPTEEDEASETSDGTEPPPEGEGGEEEAPGDQGEPASVAVDVSAGTEVKTRLWVSAKEPSVGDAKREAKCEEFAGVTGEKPGRIAFNVDYMSDVLKVLENKVEVSCSNPSSPGVFRQVGDDNYLQVIMPMFVQW